MKAKKILAAVVNHNCNSKALHLKALLSSHFDTIIIDSGSPIQHEMFDIRLANVGYAGLFNAAVAEVLKHGYDWLFLICSDVAVRGEDIASLRLYMDQLGDNVGVYAPSASGRCQHHCKNSDTGGIRSVPYVEGYTFLAHKCILKAIYPVDLEVNKLGWGIDVAKGFACKTLHLRCFIDDRLTVHHEHGTGYNSRDARSQMLAWMDSAPIAGLREFWNETELTLGL